MAHLTALGHINLQGKPSLLCGQKTSDKGENSRKTQKLPKEKMCKSFVFL